MPSSREHTSSGVLLIMIFFYLHRELNFLDYIPYEAALLIGTVYPDWLEPAKSYKHRNIFHSKRALLISILTLEVCLPLGLFGHPYFLIPAVFLIGYILHLLLDWTTKMGLPY